MPGRKGYVVIVEDDVGLNQALSRLLQAAGFDTDSYGSAAAALGSESIRQADCLVLDVQLSEMTGFDLQRRLQKSGHSPPAIIITAHDDMTSQREAREIGAVAYLTKPFAGRALVDAVERTMESGAGGNSDR
jgi:FixJ family two-component response regulator